MESREHRDLLLVFKQQSMLVDDPEPSRFVQFIDGDIRFLDVDDDDGVAGGEFRLIKIDLEAAVNEGVESDAVFDSESVTYPYHVLYDENLDFTPAVLKACGTDDVWQPNLLILDRLVLAPEWRGGGYGLSALRWLILRLSSGCGMVAIKPFPLQFEGRGRHDPGVDHYRLADLPTKNEAAITRKLQRHYGRLGFKKVGTSEFMVLHPQKLV